MTIIFVTWFHMYNNTFLPKAMYRHFNGFSFISLILDVNDEVGFLLEHPKVPSYLSDYKLCVRSLSSSRANSGAWKQVTGPKRRDLSIQFLTWIGYLFRPWFCGSTQERLSRRLITTTHGTLWFRTLALEGKLPTSHMLSSLRFFLLIDFKTDAT